MSQESVFTFRPFSPWFTDFGLFDALGLALASLRLGGWVGWPWRVVLLAFVPRLVVNVFLATVVVAYAAAMLLEAFAGRAPK